MVPKRLNEFSELSKDFLAEMRAKLGLVLPYEFLFKLDSNPKPLDHFRCEEWGEVYEAWLSVSNLCNWIFFPKIFLILTVVCNIIEHSRHQLHLIRLVELLK